MRAHLVGLGLSLLGTVACGSTAFSGIDGGPDGPGSTDDAAGHPEATRDAKADAGRHDAAGRDATSDDATKKDGGLGHDANMTVEAGHDAGVDTAAPVDAHVDDARADASEDAHADVRMDAGFCGNPPGDGIFVNAVAAPTTGCGAITQPCADLATGLAAASTAHATSVYVATGTYAAFTLVDGISVIGGWSVDGDTWTQTCSAATTIVRGAVTGSISATVLGQSLANGLELRELTIENDTTAPAGGSLYGLFVTYATITSPLLTLDDVIVTVNVGGAGATLPSPTTVPPPAMGYCTAPTSTAPGMVGTAGGAPGVSSAGFVALEPDGSLGAIGGQGIAGAPGKADCDPEPSVTCVPPVQTGHPCTTRSGTSGTLCDTPGSGGCGGTGGLGGASGGGGGSSIGLFVWGNVTVALVGGSVTGGAGGAGGAGSGGGPGGVGNEIGQMGMSATATGLASGCTGGTACDTSFTGTLTVTPTATATGGPGGPGSKGGQGGGGAGGDSYGYYAGTGTTVNVTGTTVTAGAPGALGAPNGVAGTAAPNN
jgi:hypothetical protein